MPPVRQGPKRQACVRCRSSKVRCDVVEFGDQGCTRCRQSNVECELTPLHRRFDRSRGVETRVNASRLLLKPASTLVSKPREATPSQVGSETLNRTDERDAQTQHFASTCHACVLSSATAPQATLKARNLDGLFLDGPTIKILFDTFISRYLPLVPFLNSSIEPDACFDRSPLLFWSIITVAARRSELDEELVLEITRRTVALAISSSNTASISVIESSLLLLTWWLPTVNTITETPTVMVGALLHLAMRMGLHNPIRSQDYFRVKIHLTPADLAHRANLWAHTVVLYQKYWSIGGTPCESFSKFGLDPHKALGHKRTLIAYERALLDITTSSLQVLARESEKSEAGEPVQIDSHIKLADERIAAIKPLILDDHPSMEELYWTIGRLLVYSHHLHQQLPGPTEMTLELYHIAFAVLSIMQRLAQYRPHYAALGTMYEFQCSILAMNTILRLTKLPAFATLVDTDAWNQLLNATISLQTEFAFGKHDENIGRRLGKLFQMVKTSDEVFRDKDGNLSLELRIKTRGPVSIIHDCAWWSRQDVNPQLNAYHGNLPLYMQHSESQQQVGKDDSPQVTNVANPSPSKVLNPVNGRATVENQELTTAMPWQTPALSFNAIPELSSDQDMALPALDWDIFDSLFLN